MQTRRSKKLIQVRFQLKWVALVMLASGFCLAIQSMILVITMGGLARSLPEDGDALMAAMPAVLGTSVGVSALILLPFLGFVALLLTFRIAGPIHRMQSHLRGLLTGEVQGDCRLRKDDDFQELCSLINQVQAMRTEAPNSGESAQEAA